MLFPVSAPSKSVCHLAASYLRRYSSSFATGLFWSGLTFISCRPLIHWERTVLVYRPLSRRFSQSYTPRRAARFPLVMTLVCGSHRFVRPVILLLRRVTAACLILAVNFPESVQCQRPRFSSLFRLIILLRPTWCSCPTGLFGLIGPVRPFSGRRLIRLKFLFLVARLRRSIPTGQSRLSDSNRRWWRSWPFKL